MSEKRHSSDEGSPFQCGLMADSEGEVTASLRARCMAIEAMTAELNQARDGLGRALRTMEVTEQEAADLLSQVAALRRRPSRAMITYAAVIGLAAGGAAFLVLLGLLTLAHVLSG